MRINSLSFEMYVPGTYVRKTLCQYSCPPVDDYISDTFIYKFWYFDVILLSKAVFSALNKNNEGSVLLTWFMGQKPRFLTMLQVTYVFHFFQHFIILRSGYVRYTMYFFLRISFLCCSRLVHKNHIFRYTITRIHLLPTNSSHQRPSSQTHLIHPLKHLDWKPRHFEDGKID